jgi:hypothetical protein
MNLSSLALDGIYRVTVVERACMDDYYWAQTRASLGIVAPDLPAFASLFGFT